MAQHTVLTDYTNVNLENANVKVYVRLRPTEDGIPPDIFAFFDDTPGKIVVKVVKFTLKSRDHVLII